MADYAPPGAGDFDAMARQYWNLWGDALRQWSGGAPAPTPAPGWQQALDWWSKLVPGGAPGVDDVVQRFRHQSGDWFGQMQQLAARFAGQDASAADVAQAWKQMLGVDLGHGPWRDFLGGLQGGGSGGFDSWYRQVRPYIDNLQREAERWMHLPTFGPMREHQERWQGLAQAQQDYQRSLLDYEQTMLHVAQLALARFESLLAARAEPGQQVTSARALFDLWIDAAEQAYAEVALSPEFRRVYGALTNAQMQLRLAVTTEIEQICLQLGMPTRTEVDSAYRKIADLERRLHRMERRGKAEAATRQANAAPARKAAAPVQESPRQRPVEADSGERVAASVKRTAAPRRATADKRKAAVKVSKAKPNTGKARVAARSAAPASRTATAPVAEAKPGKVAKPATTAKPGKSAPVVSMKDWVARYAGDEDKKQAGKKQGRRK
ncbi:class III poly(R)-hydroxyalkanoic acid synthase subunit PhaE [Pseudoxanthomonas indica]|uniref:Poly(3-hydroxyalkanoate) polymerase subunit PhaE n=1 Tax=Pseudoxanthomonas indica TaxID=428993 RepID=A0A1T5IY34_9GAMM|nr:class III poly(R)-hydroxyalkanoic acid synthase subunit PhaE [Pseudoxanthomonas indica]GGD55010.1 class III poly(R)-hydroxyalkanoic acid synthase subunit PhaE [Pseudoxanthomonas indica]SKC44106.1 poly(R)-hydroxyalkanoic acid synthase, class III, PhaE subunit [Pseudoxanthomonas indica]